jgi:hypothetical protein
MAEIITFSGASYWKFENPSEQNTEIILNPFDASGNLFPNITIDISQDGEGGVKILLPTINTYEPAGDSPNTASLNGNYNCSIRIIKSTASGALYVNANTNTVGKEGISGSQQYAFTSTSESASVLLTPISFGNWGIIVSQNAPD